jgi:omega-6 fatty acid desaturase (delta-12 desaturase)
MLRAACERRCAKRKQMDMRQYRPAPNASAVDHVCDPPERGASDHGSQDLQSQALASEAELLGQTLARQFRAYGADLKRSLFQLITTATPFIALLAIMVATSDGYYWLTLLLAIPTAGLLVRLFIIQHDCGHGSFFKSRVANDVLGRALGILTLTPYGHWKRGHAAHHASTGNLDRRGRGDVATLTVAEYQALGPLKKLGYRLYRNPFVMVLLGAPINFIVLQRLPTGQAFRDPDARRSILSLNVALVVVFGLPMLVIGIVPVLATYLPVMIIAAWIGNWLFYVQHQFEDAYWEQDRNWNFHGAALSGSSYFQLPPILQWFSGNIGLHHVHHLCSRVPNYRLQACLDTAPELHRFTQRISLRDSLGCWRLALWDEQRRLLVRFRDLKPQGT